MVKKRSKKSLISPEMTIAEIIFKHPETTEVFLKYGFHCFGCMGASFENLKQAAKTHGIDLKKLLKDLSKL